MPFVTKLSNTEITIPMTADELTIGQFIEMRKLKPNEDNTAKMISILSGVPELSIRALRFTKKTELQIQDINTLTKELAKSINEYHVSERKFIAPDSVEILGKTIRIPKDLEKAPYWPSRKVKSILLKTKNNTPEGQEYDFTDDLPEIIAHYLYVPYTELTYNEQRAEEFLEAVKDLPFTQAIALGNFFLFKWKNLFLKSNEYWPTTILWMSRRLKYRVWKFLGRSVQ